MPIYLGNSFNAWEFGEFPQFLRESEGSLFFNYWKFIKCLAFRYIFQIPRHLRDFKISSHLRYLQNLKKYHRQSFIGTGNLGNFPNILEYGKFPKFLFSSKV